MLNRLTRAGLAVATAAALARSALADVKPDPADPSEPVGMLTIGAIVRAACALGNFLYRRRQR